MRQPERSGVDPTSESSRPASASMRGVVQQKGVSVGIRVISAGHTFVQNVRRGYYELGSDTDPKNRLTTAFAELARAI